MYHLWFERALPREFAHLLDATAQPIHSRCERTGKPAGLQEVHAIIASSRVVYDEMLIDQAPHLRVISRTGSGVDNISVPAATERGIAVCNAPHAPSISTAEHAMTLLFATAKRLKRSERELRTQQHTNFFTHYEGMELNGRRLGLIGLGRIGSRVARIAVALGMNVVAYDPYIRAEQFAELGIAPISSLEELLRTADIVSLHLPLVQETHHLMNAERLALMKPGAILINTARGGLVDEAALLDALESGRLQGAGLDVFGQEPPAPDHPLLHREDVVATPHIAAATPASRHRLWETAISQALQALRGERPPHLVNPEVWPLNGKPRR